MATSTLYSLCQLFLFFFTISSTTIADDGAFMSKLAKVLSPTPSGWSGTRFCEWKGMGCTTNRAFSINLASMSLVGTLPPDLNSHSQLTSLSLEGNELSGALPSLANLSMLEIVSLGSNNFNFIPDGCFQGLTILKSLNMTYSFNLFPWAIPTDLAQSSKHVKLDLRSTNLIGTLPDVFDSLMSLQELYLSNNNFTESLPKIFVGSRIQILWLNNQRHEFNAYDIRTYWPNIPKNEFGGLLGSIEVLASMTHLS